MTRRLTILTAALAALLALTVAWSYAQLTDARAAAEFAKDDLAECTRLAGRIGQLSHRPTLAREHEQLAAQTITLIAEAARDAGIPPAHLIRTSPQAPTRLGDTPYKQKPTRVQLRNITLQQLTAMIHKLTTTGLGLRANSLRLTAPSPDDTGNLWNAELVVSYLIYDPPKDPRTPTAPRGR
jgi:hypothetical protein